MVPMLNPYLENHIDSSDELHCRHTQFRRLPKYENVKKNLVKHRLNI